jgi:nucleoside phosphorylase
MSDLTKEEIIKRAENGGLRRALIVTALPLETRAVRAHLTHLGSVGSRDGTVYECGEFTGKFGSWLVIVAESGAGTHPAQSVVTAAHRDFDNFFDVAEFVGVAGSRKPEAPVGSVVASNILYLPYIGKYDPKRGFTARPHSLAVDHKLVGYARKVERDREWQTRIRALLNEALPDKQNYPQPYPPNAFIAPMASVEAVSADPESELEECIATHYSDTLAVEMEGYGAAHAASREETGFIVIRGISDMCGRPESAQSELDGAGKTPEKDAIHQPVAASHAAAFAFDLLDTWGRFQPNKRVPLHPASVVESVPERSSPSGSETPGKNGPVTRSKIVLNFAGTVDDFPDEKIKKILDVIRVITNDPTVIVVGTEEGSFRLVIDANQGAIDRIKTPEAIEVLSQESSVPILGVMREEDYRHALRLEDTLHRASSDLLCWPQNLPDGRHFTRPELNQLLSIIGDNENSTTVLLGSPGSGKSALLAALGQELIKQGTPFVAIKADLLDPLIQTEDDLTTSLGLPQLASSLLLQIGALRPVVLLVDQLDALAGYVDLRTGRLSVLLNLVRKLSGERNIHIVLSSRTFEFEHDSRLKTIRAESMALTLPPWSAVLQVLEAHRIQAAGWPPDAQELMRTPQALATFLKFEDLAEQPPFRTYQAMLDQLWKEQILNQPNGARISQLAGVIAERMAEKETLWLAAARYEDHAQDLDFLIASGLLTDFDGARSRIGFSHQTVFEHALARAFAQKEGRLSTFVRDRQRSLFIRPKVWAALTYLRDVEPPAYDAELQAIWSMKELRRHLKHLLIEFLGQQSKPTRTETILMDEALTSAFRREALQALMGSFGWFDLFGPTHISRAMVKKDEANLAAGILAKAWSFVPESVTSLIEKHWLDNTTFDIYTWNVLQESTAWNDELVEIAKTVLGRTEISPFAFESLVGTIAVEQPEIALKLVSARLDSQLKKATTSIKESVVQAASPPPEGVDPLLWRLLHKASEAPITDVIKQHDGWDELETLAKAHPGLFLNYVWPLFHQALKMLLTVKEENSYRPGFPLQYSFDLRLPEDHSPSFSQPPLLSALITAVEELASSDSGAFLSWLAHHEGENSSPAQRIFANALASHPDKFAERAASFLLDDTNRLHLGSLDDDCGTTKRLVKAVSPFWDLATLQGFEKTILHYSPPPPNDLDPESRRRFLNIIRRTKLGILESLPSARISNEVRRRIVEERRRFPQEKVGATFSGVREIGSPIAAKNLALASDDDILNAFRNLPDSSGWDHPKDWSKGGNIQLAREFTEFAKAHPERAMRIIKRFEPEFGTRASGYAMVALAETVEAVALFEMLETLDRRGFKGDEFRSGASRAIVRLIEQNVTISDSILAMLEKWLSNEIENSQGDKDSADEQLSLEEPNEATNEKSQNRGSVLWGHGGLSVLPSGNYPILEAITRIYLQRRAYDGLIAVYGRHLQVNENPKVWEAILRY